MSFANKQLAALNETLGGSIQDINGDRMVQFSNKKGNGSIYGAEIGGGISYFRYDIKALETTKFSFGSERSNELFFIYCSKGELSCSMGQEREDRSIVALQTAILGGIPSSVTLEIGEGADAQFAVIRVLKIHEGTGLDKDLQLNKQVFDRFLKDENQINYFGSFNLKIREQLKQIPTIQEKGVVQSLLIKGIVHFSLALEILQYDTDENNKLIGATKLTKRELLRIEEASKEIQAAPEYQFSIAYLSRKYALSPSKLQEGFKVIHGSTVTNFIKTVRVEAAERLIKHSDMNISEVVYSVGFTSRSYFSRIFKERYNCSPKYYQEHCSMNYLAV